LKLIVSVAEKLRSIINENKTAETGIRSICVALTTKTTFDAAEHHAATITAQSTVAESDKTS
jgi:hypothetical protein